MDKLPSFIEEAINIAAQEFAKSDPSPFADAGSFKEGSAWMWRYLKGFKAESLITAEKGDEDINRE
jgi:hypothetical protein